ncbi:MAG: PAS domain-containing protein [Bacteroidia bacterium]
MATAFGKSKNNIENNSSILPKLVFDNDTLEILHVNSAMAAILGYTREELLKFTLTDLVADDFSALVDNENVQFPALKIVRQFVNKKGDTVNCLSQTFELDFDSSAILVYNAKYFAQSTESHNFTSDVLVDNAYASMAFNRNYRRN